jgi:predicted ATPase/DNA-binding CsgD family transcriptional regulator
MCADFWQPLLDPLTDRELEILRYVADGSSDREIAEALFLSLNTIKWHNRQIYSKLGVGSRTQAVALVSQAGLLEEKSAPLEAAAIERRHNIPAQVTTFVGREKEIGEVRRLLESTRLLTLTGPGGVGKTRLAIRAATEVAKAGAFEDGIFFVDLAPVSQPERVADAIVEALGVMTVVGQPIPKILEKYIGNKKLLLLLDNFEHLLDAAPLVGDLLSAAPDLSVLATSREALNLYGEQEYPVPPLGVPDLSDPSSLSRLTEYEAAALFIQRAQAVKPDFSFSDEDAPRVAEICVRLDGLPLAIELAAAQVKLFSPQALLDQMESRFTALRGGPRGLPERRRTLRGAIDWSYELLDDPEKTLFTRLSVFQGGRTIEAIEAVCCHDQPIDVVDKLAALLNKNLLRIEEGPQSELRFTMLETIHEYAFERLQESGGSEDIQRRHAEYFTALAERTRPDIRGGPNQPRRLHQLELEQENLRAAMEWSLAGTDAILGMRLVGALGHFWWRQGHYTEGQRWTTLALEAERSLDTPEPVRANLLDAAGLVAHFSHERERGMRMHLEALALYERLGHKREMGWVFIYLGAQSFGKPDEYEEAMAHAEEGLSLLRSVEDKAGIAQALHVLGELARLHGNYGHATRIFEEGLALAREIGDGIRQAFILDSLGYLALYDDDPQTAAALARESLKLALEVGYKPHVPACLAGLAAAYMADGMTQHAVRLFGAADALFAAHGFSPRPSDKPDVERTWVTVREMRGNGAFDAAWAEGQAMSLEEAIAYALEEPAADR